MRKFTESYSPILDIDGYEEIDATQLDFFDTKRKLIVPIECLKLIIDKKITKYKIDKSSLYLFENKITIYCFEDEYFIVMSDFNNTPTYQCDQYDGLSKSIDELDIKIRKLFSIKMK